MGYGKGTRHPSFLETQCSFPRPFSTLRHRWSDGVLLPAMGGYFHHEFWKTGSLWLYQLYLSRYLCMIVYRSVSSYIHIIWMYRYTYNWILLVVSCRMDFILFDRFKKHDVFDVWFAIKHLQYQEPVLTRVLFEKSCLMVRQKPIEVLLCQPPRKPKP